MKVGVTGASGFLGSALVPALRAEGHDVVRFVRRPAGAIDERHWDGAYLPPDAVADLGAVVHLAGAGVGDRRWTQSYKRAVIDSRVKGTTAVATAVALAGTPVLLSASAIGWYGDTGDTLTDETGPRGKGFLAEVCDAWESATAGADPTARVVHLRSGIVLAGKGGALRKQLPLFRAGLGAPLGSGRQWQSWISLQDEVAAISHLLTADVAGPVNLVAPAPVTNREFTKALGKAVHRPTWPVGVPGFALKLALGQFAQEGVLTGQRLAPAVLDRSGFTFAHREVLSALQAGLAQH
ncbi:MAG: hypothetical protein JWM02_3344 [Frankiales bacterium]|nr:hypothetical protein [Frankiales bacterium]